MGWPVLELREPRQDIPSNLTIAAFVFGAVLLLLALAGGKFKLFGAQVSGTIGKFARILAFVIGVGLISFGLLNQELPNPPGKTSDSVSGTYQGDCRNSESGMSGNLWLVISKDPAGKITGNLNLTGELIASGNIEGQVSDNIISFHNSIESGLPNFEREKFELFWTGKLKGNVIEGEYTAVPSPTLKFKGTRDQKGIWKVTKFSH
jgi:hypothetical protein